MINVVSITGSYRGKKSLSSYCVDRVIETLRTAFKTSLTSSQFDPKKNLISDCVGATTCFRRGKCSIRDDMELIKKKMEEADIIIFSAPVYAHGIPGVMKTFFDRIAHWTHLFHLRGKLCIILSISDTNGNNYVSMELQRYAEYLGMVVVGSIEIKTGILSNEGIDSILRKKVSDIVTRIKNKNWSVSQNQEESFHSFKKVYLEGLGGSEAEHNYWRSNLCYFNTYSDAFNNQYNLDKNVPMEQPFSLEHFLSE
ncbi:multimeric flavodoxin WrbA [Enterococcus rotai]|uniref:NADPH-dependent FMN reductase-like domain-containing protein n=1 Tax=Enterococcus rotai TaxID=118060 RepID=A0A0U2LUQ8_9ENTE|nr:flavodoxin family protein [Enterococcus rotai]ALS36405.1 hypothetical protein ATZ35_04280 [Enterococcus rotai]